MMHLVKPIVGIMTSKIDLLDGVLVDLKGRFGRPDIIGRWRIFDHTNYYEGEMGSGLKRCFVSFEDPVAPESSVDFKAWSAEAEGKYSVDGRRAVNLDAGYIDANKVVLMTGKHGGHKIAVAPGVWADFLLWYNKGWVALPWAFPDFRDGGYFPTFMKMRARFKEQMR